MKSFSSTRSSNSSYRSSNLSSRKPSSSSTYAFQTVSSPPNANSTMVSDYNSTQISPIRPNYSMNYSNSSMRNSSINSTVRNQSIRSQYGANSSASFKSAARNSTIKSSAEISRLSRSGVSNTSQNPAQKSSCSSSSRALVPRRETSQPSVLIQEPPSPPKYPNVNYLVATSPTDDELKALGLGHLIEQDEYYYTSQTCKTFANRQGKFQMQVETRLRVNGDYATMSRVEMRKRIKSH